MKTREQAVPIESDNSKIRLASNWTVRRVSECLNGGQKHEVIRFLCERYNQRFLGPIHLLLEAKSNEHGFGFAIIALCSLLIETLECYRKGLPTSLKADFDDLIKELDTAAMKKQIAELQFPGSGKMFEDFFDEREHKQFFPDVKGSIFYHKIRCGLLHQAQTKSGWRITRSGKYWDETARTIGRDEFARRLTECFNAFLEELRTTGWKDGIWPKVQRKIWWLTKTS